MMTTYLRPRKASAFKALSEALTYKTGLRVGEATDVLLVPRGQIPAPFPPSVGEYIVDDNDFLTEILPPKSREASRRLSGRTLYGGWLRRIWGHFLMGGLARMWVATIPQFLDGIDHVLFFSGDFDGTLSGNYLEVMELLGVAGKMVILDSPVEVEHLLIPEISFEHDVFNSAECKATFRYICNKALSEDADASEMPRKVFLTRSALKSARTDEVNLDKLDRLFADNGFEVISPEQISLARLIRIFHHAEEIASISGSTAHNFVFSLPDRNRRYTIIERHATPNTFQINIDRMLGITPDYIDSFHMPVFSSSQDRPVLYAMTGELESYAKERGWNIIGFGHYDSVRQRRHELARYLLRHRRYFGNSESFEPWEVDCASVLAEAVMDARDYYSPWLRDLRPLLWYDYLTPRFYMRALKRLVTHLRR